MNNASLKIRLGQAEKEKIFHDAKRCGMTASAYARQLFLGHRPKAKDTTLLRNELSKLGGLLKHLHNEGFGHSAQTAEILLDIKIAIRNIDKREG